MIPGIIAQRRGGAIPPGPVSSSDVLWTPAAISTALWLDADDASTFTLAGSSIDEWRDKSGNARHATPPTATKPTRTASGINSMGSVVFGSATDPLLTSAFSPPTAANGLLMAMVARRTGEPVNFSNVLTFGAVNAQWSLLWARASTDNISYWRGVSASAQTAASPSSTLANDTNYLWAGDLSNAALRQYKNGTELSGSLGAATRDLGSSAALTIGSSPDSSYSANRFQGQFGELVLVHADVTTTTRQLIEGCLAWKWGLQASLPVGHPYELAAPTV